MNLGRTVVFSVIPLVLLILLFEVIGRVVYFQNQCSFPTVLNLVFHKTQRAYLECRTKRAMHRMKGARGDLFWNEQGRNVRESFMRKYRADFDGLLREVKISGGQLIVVFFPCDDYEKRKEIVDQARAFFFDLTKSREVPFLDLTSVFRQYPVTWVTLLPENGHLSRFGNQIAAKEIASFVDTYFADYRSTVTYLRRPRLFGDLVPAQRTINDMSPLMPYRLVTNRQGLRMDYEITFPKQRQRILMLGDSVTYGPYLHDQDILSNQLSKVSGSREYINAGVPGYTIVDELEFFVERAKYIEPDIVILEVLENDINGYFSSLLNEFARKRQYYAPTEEEKEFIEKAGGLDG